MTLKTVAKSANKKTGEIAVTYRSGTTSNFGTCPKGCNLNPKAQESSDSIDKAYLRVLQEDIPEGVVSWTYSHFPWKKWFKKGSKTTINFSANTISEATDAVKAGVPTVLVAAKDATAKVLKLNGTRLVRCPAEYLDKINCQNCGSGSPLCSRAERNYVIKFTAHGSGARKALNNGGCYANYGPTGLQWRKTTKQKHSKSDCEVLKEFVNELPVGSMVRHHVAGDIGKG